MGRLRLAGLLFCVFLSVAVPALCAEGVRYTGKALRDPFIDQSDIAPPVDDTAVIQQSISSMQVQGILYALDNPLAIIDGKIYRVGSRLSAGQVVRIEKEGVTVSQDGKQFTIKQSRGKTNATT